MTVMDKDYIQKLIDDLVGYQKKNKILGYGLERQMIKSDSGPGYVYGDEIYIKFTIKD
ncbi:hypothetical protein [Virgibacillus sp. Bac332]|uniref:hypothetical protein n=1 Tax=Virgibacillus sp. Bac332 TaxID=2419842 RepID=UPI0013CF3EE3|nr:hypothetical protein [Virgibacillus sp. Bac332]